MDNKHQLLFAALVLFCEAERQYFFYSNVSTWDQARLHCQICYKDMVSLTSDNIQLLVNNLSHDYWIGLRKSLDNNSLQWSSWSNGDPVIFQNWYPGRPILSPPKDPVINNYNTYILPTPTPTPTPSACGCCCDTPSSPTTFYNDNYTDYPNATVNVNLLSTTSATTRSTEVTTSNPTMGTTLFTGVTAPSNESNHTVTDGYIADPCIAMLSCGLWYERVCTMLLPYICYEDRFYGNANISGVTLHNASLSWASGPADINDYRVEVKAKYYSRNVTHSSLNYTNLTYQLSNLTAGTLYSIQVFPIKCERDLNPENVSFYTKPDIINNLKITDISLNSISLSWLPPNGNCDFYSVQVTGGPDETIQVNNSYVVVANLTSGGLYRFDVNAEVKDQSIKGAPQNISKYTKPGIVQNLTVHSHTNDTVWIEWKPPVGNTSGYRIEYFVDSNIRTHSTTKTTNFLVNGLPQGTMIHFTVFSLVADLSVDGDPQELTGLTNPGSVTDLQLEPQNTTITVTWKAPTGKYSNFTVQVNLTDTGEQEFLGNTNNLSSIVSNLKPGVQYTVSVITLNGDLLSEPRKQTVYTYPTSPESLQIVSFNQSQVSIKWKPPSASGNVPLTYSVTASSYFINCTKTELYPYQTKNTNHTFAGLTTGTKYEFNVSVQAGSLASLPITISQTTAPEIKVLIMTLECASNISLHCEDDTVKKSVKEQLSQYLHGSLQDFKIWNVILIPS
ncbi:hypothetical protein UPYG_G00241280 [Umbra pygmaea]|uniref:Uncharacterized protein n=1 Tax=Umbra pygmaea TaxID=75934 RepID=A0ABD0X375_UMBPY